MRTLSTFLLLISWRGIFVHSFVPKHLSSSAGVSQRRPSSAVRASDLLEGLAELPNPFKALEAPEASLGDGSSEQFEPTPAGLIQQAKRVLSSELGLQDASLLDDSQFRWIGPVVDKPLSKRDYLAAGRFFDIRRAFPDLDYRAHDFRVDEVDEATVRITVRITGTMRGELRLRNEVLQPTGQTMVCPPEAVSMTFDLKNGKVTKLCTGFALDRLVGNTGGTTGVMAAAVTAGQEVSDWEIYPPTTCLQRFFGRPVPQLPEAKVFLAPFPETVMVQLAKGILAADMAAEDPTLLSDDFTFCTPYVGPIRKNEFLEKYAREELIGVDPSFSYFRVDPYDPVRVWVDVRPSAPGFEGAPQDMSFTFDDEGFCTRITSWAVMDPSIGNGGGLGGPEGFKYAVGDSSPAVATRPLPRSLGRLRKRALEVFTGIGVDDYSLPGGDKEVSTPQRKVPKAEVGPATPLERLSSLKAEAMPALKARQEEEKAEINAQKADAERRLREAQKRKAAAVAERGKQEAQQRALADQKTEAERKRKEAQAKQSQAAAEKQKQLAAQKAETERKRIEAQERQTQAAAEKKRQLDEQKAEAERKRKEAQEKQAQAATERQRKLAEQKAEAERKRIEVQEEQARAVAERQRRLDEQRADTERRRKEAEAQAQAAAERQRQLAQQKAEADRKRKEEQERRQRDLAEQKAQVERKRQDEQERKAAAAAERQRQLAEKKAEAERKRQEAEEARRLQLLAKQAEREALAEEQRLKQAVSKASSGATINLFGLGGAPDNDSKRKDTQRQKLAALDAASKASPGASISLFGLGAKPDGDSKQEQNRKAARDAASKASPGASISLFGSGAKQPQKRKAAVDAASKASPGASISLFGMGGKQDGNTQQKQKAAQDQNAARKRNLAEQSARIAEERRQKQATAAEQKKRELAAKASEQKAQRERLAEERRQKQAAAAEQKKRELAAKAAEQKAQRERLAEERRQKQAAAAAERERLAEERRQKQAAVAEQKKKELAAKKADAEKNKRQKAAVDSVSNAGSGSTINLFGLGGGKSATTSSGSPSLPLSKGSQAGKKAPAGVPSLTRWKKNGDGSITGLIRGAKNFRDGEKVTTSPIASGKIGKGEVVRTGSGSRYFLS